MCGVFLNVVVLFVCDVLLVWFVCVGCLCGLCVFVVCVGVACVGVSVRVWCVIMCVCVVWMLCVFGGV